MNFFIRYISVLALGGCSIVRPPSHKGPDAAPSDVPPGGQTPADQAQGPAKPSDSTSPKKPTDPNSSTVAGNSANVTTFTNNSQLTIAQGSWAYFSDSGTQRPSFNAALYCQGSSDWACLNKVIDSGGCILTTKAVSTSAPGTMRVSMKYNGFAVKRGEPEDFAQQSFFVGRVSFNDSDTSRTLDSGVKLSDKAIPGKNTNTTATTTDLYYGTSGSETFDMPEIASAGILANFSFSLCSLGAGMFQVETITFTFVPNP